LIRHFTSSIPLRNSRSFVVEEPEFEFKKPVFRKKIDLPKASDYKISYEYLTKRGLDPQKFYFTDKFKEWTNQQKQTFDTIGRDEPRIIIPMYDRDKNWIGYQGRALNSSPNKYITIMLDEGAPKVYGLDQIRTDAPVYVTEGPFDSTFICNSIAMCGADVDLSGWGISNPVWVYDNEPRNREIVNRISRTIDKGDSLIIWPSNVVEKDINDMVLAGHDIMNVLKSNTYSGLEAKIKFNNWKKI
jgi:hypothetical protein